MKITKRKTSSKKKLLSTTCKACGFKAGTMAMLRKHYRLEPDHKPKRYGKYSTKRKNGPTVVMPSPISFCPCCGVNLGPFHATMAAFVNQKETR